VWKREHLEYRGRYYSIPLLDGHGSVLGKPLKPINHPVREGIPMPLAALGPKNVELAAALAEGWQPIFFLPERAESV
jgi:alkanesulfonate monooxygenase SsuD/methylene tetrahydromethanopterin reductase-like flavin-dependent oxidoreductase (luciferase family)